MCLAQWEEPFGLTAIEANACGVPIIATRRGALPEIVQHGRNGFLVEQPKEAGQYIKNINQGHSTWSREAFEQRFTAEAMTDKYFGIYNSILHGTAQSLANSISR